MNDFKCESINLIESIPDERTDAFIKILKNIREVLSNDSKPYVDKNLKVMDEIQNIIGKDIPWASEEEMLRELAETRRQRLNA